MHVLFLSDNFIPETNAAASRVYERAAYWVKWGHRVTVLTSAPNKPEGKVYPGYKNAWVQRENIQGIEIVRVKTFITKNEGFTLRMIDFLSYMFMSFLIGLFLPRPDVVCATSPQFFTAVSGWAVAKLRRLPFVFEVSDLWPGSIAAVGVVKFNLFLTLAEKLELFLYRQADLVVALTHAFKEDIASRGIDPGKIAVILNGVDLSRLKPEPRDRELSQRLGLDGKFVVGYLGTHGLAQGLKHVVEMIGHPRLVARAEVHFLFVGAGAERELVMKRAEELALKNITFLEARPKSEIPKLWSLVDIALVSLKDDPVFRQFIPSKIFEAMGAGKPILLVCPRGEAGAIIDDCGCGWSLEPSARESFVDAILTGLTDKTLIEQFKSRSEASAPSFSRQTQAQIFLRNLNHCVPSDTQTDKAP